MSLLEIGQKVSLFQQIMCNLPHFLYFYPLEEIWIFILMFPPLAALGGGNEWFITTQRQYWTSSSLNVALPKLY